MGKSKGKQQIRSGERGGGAGGKGTGADARATAWLNHSTGEALGGTHRGGAPAEPAKSSPRGEKEARADATRGDIHGLGQ
ncbi:hypothetical protein niasHT_018948 [Heterodera trifolii]|uniref:Uncharacterized protein n=1 Tax=Heterodera trifolii TaxID=157864 RepID=A0ABD2LDM3_9BILA